MGLRTRTMMLALGVGTLAGAMFAQRSMGRHRSDLFSGRPLRRLSALGYLSGHPSVDSVRLLRDYLDWEEHPMLQRRARSIVRRMEAKLG
jgi:hypothetical protein